MSGVIDSLRSLDRKERFAVLREALALHRTAPELGRGFRERLGARIGVPLPTHAFVAMDYHLDWIQMALHLGADSDIELGQPFENPGFGDINRDQEDIDLLVALDSGEADRPATHIVLIEAKAYLPWTNRQLESKTRRLGGIFGDDGTRHDAVKPHFVLMTGRRSNNVCTREWPGWTKDAEGNPFWLEYDLPCRRKVTRCTPGGKPAKNGRWLRLDPVVPRSGDGPPASGIGRTEFQ